MTRPFVIYLHIQKTAGITLQRVFRRRLGASLPRRALKLLRPRHYSSMEEVLRSQTQRDRYFTGHMCYGVHELLPSPSTYVTFLREPVSRLVSLYRYSRDNPAAYYHKQAAGKSAEEFLLNTTLHELDNGQVRFLAGGDPGYFINRTPFRQCDRSLLDQAIANAERDFSLIGLTESFDESFMLLCRLMGWRRTYYLTRNAAAPRARDPISDEVREQVRERNLLDVELYEYAVRRHQRAWEQSGLQSRLESFQRGNTRFQQWFGRPYSVYSDAKARLRGRSDAPH